MTLRAFSMPDLKQGQGTLLLFLKLVPVCQCAGIAPPIRSGELGRGLWCENRQEGLIKSAESDECACLPPLPPEPSSIGTVSDSS